MDEANIELVERWATCLTVECGNFGASINVLTLVGGDVECGVCQEPISDIADIEPTEGTVLPQWILDQLAMQNSDN